MKKTIADPQIAYILLAIATIGVYAHSFDNPFHYDDLHSIVDNPHIRNLGRVPSYFTDPTAFSVDAKNAMYRPLLLATFALNYAISGYEVWSYHLLALLLHLACAFLVGILSQQLLGNRWAAYFAAGLFALHPINSEPVNYISSRSEILAAFFVLLGFCAYLRRGHLWGLCVALAFAAGLLSKSTAVVLPALLLVYELIIRRRFPVAEKGLFAALAGLFVLYVSMVWSLIAKATVGAPVRPYDQQIWTQVKAMVFYLQLLVWPSPQNVDHQFQLSDSFFDPIAGSAACLLLSLVALALYHRHRHPLVLFCLGWFFIVLAPSSIVPLNVLVNEHRLYLPGAAFALFLAYAGLRLKQKIGAQCVGGLGLVILVASGYATVQRNGVWQDEYALWGDAAAKAPLMARPFIYLGGAYVRDGRVTEAIAAFSHVVRRDPNFSLAYVQLGKLYREQGRDDLAVDILEQGLQVDRSAPEIWAELAELYRLQQDWPKSLSAYEQAVEWAPNDPGLRNNLGNTYQVLGRGLDALSQHQQALTLMPEDAETLLNLGNAHKMLRQMHEALVSYRRALAVREDFAGAWFNMGYLLEEMGDSQQAMAAYHRAAALDPAFAAKASAYRKTLVGKP